MFKKTLSILLSLCILFGTLTILPISASAEDKEIAKEGADSELSATGATQKAMFIMDTINISQGMYGNFSHQGSMAIDLAGKDGGKDPAYAPFDGKVVYMSSSAAYIIYESLNPVEYADGTVDYMTVWVMHDDNVGRFYVGQTFSQGEHFFDEGSSGYATGNHIHLECARGTYARQYQNSYGVWCLNNQIAPYDALYLSESTNIIDGYGYNWRRTSSAPSFTPVDIGTNFYGSIVNLAVNKPIKVSSGNVVCGVRNGSDEQKWRFERQGDTSYKIINVANGECLDDDNYGTTDNTNIKTCGSNDSDAQRWYFRNNGSGYSLVPKCATNLSMDLYNGISTEGNNLAAWTFVENNGNQIFGIDHQPSFQPQNLGSRFTAAILHTSSGAAVSAASDDNVVIQQYNGSKNQLWLFERADDRMYKITNLANGKALDLDKGGTTDDTNIHTWDSLDNLHQRWYFRKNGSGYSLLPKCSFNLSMDLYNGNSTSGTNLAGWTFVNGNGNQIFTLQMVDTPTCTETFNGHKYELYNTSVAWKEAFQFCEQQGGHLVTITSQEEQSFINNMLTHAASKRVWAGAVDVYTEGKWQWITGESFSYKNWGSGEPNNSGDEDYLMLSKSDGAWNDVADIFNNTDFGYSFICEYDDSIDPARAKLEKTFDYNNHRYEIYSGSLDWLSAKQFCEQKGGHLVTITTAGENSTIVNNVKALNHEAYWLGLTDVEHESKWHWITDEVYSYKNWNDNEPNNSGGIEDYAVYVLASGKWNDLSGRAVLNTDIGFICEYDSLPKIVLQDNMVTVSDVVTTSDATTVNPTVTVKVDGKALKKDTDYTVTVKRNVAYENGIFVLKPDGTVTVTGKGDYTGTVIKNFKITIDDRNTITDSQGHTYKADQDEIVTFIIRLTSSMQVNHLNGVLYYNQEIMEPIITDDMRYHTPAFSDGQFRQNTPGQIEFDIFSETPATLNNSTVIEMQFRMTTKGGQGWLSHEFRNPEFTWDNINNYGLETQVLTNQELYIPKKENLGDVDGDGKATIIDATLIQRHCVGITVNGEFNEAAADVDGSGDIEISDATFIQRYDANTETPYKIGEAIE